MTDSTPSGEGRTRESAAKAVAPRELDRIQDHARAEAYRLRVQALADYMNAYPLSEWPRFALAVGASLFAAGSTVAVITSLAQWFDWLGAFVLYGVALALVAGSLWVLRANQRMRETKYAEARQLFWQWANRAQEPYIVFDTNGTPNPGDL